MPITYKCPACGAAMEFDSESQHLKCTQCGNEFDVRQYERMYNNSNDTNESSRGAADNDYYGTDSVNKGFQSSDNVNNNDCYGNNDVSEEKMNMKIYHCSSCGAQLMSDEFTSAVICSFCGNPSLVEDRLQGEYKPSFIIPFKIDRQNAVDIYKKWVKKGKLTPKTLSSQSTIEKISGIYVPFWLYDYNAQAKMSANTTRIRKSRRGDTEYTYTDHFHVYRDVEADFHRVPADASQQMDDACMDKMEPYDYSELEPFAMPYLSGYLSERYNFTDAQMRSRVEQRVSKYISDIARNTITGYNSVVVVNNDIRMKDIHNEYALLPVWVLNCRYDNKEFQFMLNGQTGKIVAERPISKKLAVLWGIGIFAVSLLIMMFGGALIL